ncbi:MAG: hypothetical protein MUF35_04690 [Candidatus Nanopelagicales bacterium]|jgi:hypothetical protein|nr:hypothetical protein [Candidatus Nanopelagicales bacterium]
MGTIVCVIEGDEFYNRNAVLVWAQLGESAVEFRAHRSRPDGKWQLHRNGTELGRFVDIDDVLDYLEGL